MGSESSGVGKGKTNNKAGRPKGVKNKVTQETRKKLNELLDGYGIDQMRSDLLTLKPAERLKVVTGLLPFVMPKMVHNINENQDINIIFQDVSESDAG